MCKVYKRNLIIWADHASILNSGHLLLTIKVLYEPVLFFTNEEFQEKNGYFCNIQEIVETPSIYIFGHCHDSIAEKLTYIEERLKDVQEMTEPLKIEVNEVQDTLRFFHGDHPEIQFESGNLHGGNFPCLCGCKAKNFTNLENVYTHKILSQEQRRQKVIAGPAGRKMKVIAPFQDLPIDKLGLEVNIRGIDRYINIHNKLKKKDLQDLLHADLKGLSRSPALCFGNEFKSMAELNLGNYEVCPVEPLHDCKGHIKNVWDVLPEVLNKEEKLAFDNVLQLLFSSKDQKRGSDYRASTILVYEHLKNVSRTEIKKFLRTLMELVKMAYLPAQKRSPKIILRIYNVAFQHALLCQKILPTHPKKVTNRKLYGIYFHSLTTHLPEMARIISPSSLHTENEEQLFSQIKNVSLSTSSRTLSSIRDNSILRIQIEKRFMEDNAPATSKASKTSMVSKFSHCTDNYEGTKLNSGLNQRLLQAHLER